MCAVVCHWQNTSLTTLYSDRMRERRVRARVCEGVCRCVCARARVCVGVIQQESSFSAIVTWLCKTLR